jgi:hypothetical protein
MEAAARACSDGACTLGQQACACAANQHQCEVALRYCEARATIGEQVYAEMAAECGDRHEWDESVRLCHITQSLYHR